MQLYKSINTRRLFALSLFTFFALTTVIVASENDDLPWQGKKAAVVLTYDDAIAEQLDNAVPLLDSLNLKATFYITPYFEGFKQRISEWQRVANSGHELGNHTLYHPCDGSLEGREWVNKNYDLSSYTVKRMGDEINVCNVLLQILDGKKERTFAYTCGDMKAGDSLFTDQIKNQLRAARAVRSEMHTIDQIDVFNIDSYMISGENAAELIALVNQAKEKKALLVFLFHGVNGGHSLNVSSQAHRELLVYLKDHQNEIWTTTMIDAVNYIEKNRSEK
jgi:sialate O-acetylesterase